MQVPCIIKAGCGNLRGMRLQESSPIGRLTTPLTRGKQTHRAQEKIRKIRRAHLMIMSSFRKTLLEWRRTRRIRKNSLPRPSFEKAKKLKNKLRGIVRKALWCGNSKACVALVGCTSEDLRAHIQGQFKPGMSWGNFGKGKGCWHVDHRMPCASFDLENPTHRARCFHYTNFQPLWAEENWSKGAAQNQSHQMALL